MSGEIVLDRPTAASPEVRIVAENAAKEKK